MLLCVLFVIYKEDENNLIFQSLSLSSSPSVHHSNFS